MWKVIYNILVNAVLPLFIILSIFKKKLRKNLHERLFNTTGVNPLKNAIWIHAASIGEAIIAESLINFLKKYKKGLNGDFLITTNTFYARDMLLKKFSNSLCVSSLPLDLTFTIDHFIDGSTFKAFIIIETEIWPNLIWTAKKRSIPVIIVNGRISDKTFPIYQRFTFFLRHVLACIDIVLAQSEEHRKRYISIGMDPDRVITTGNIKYYRETPLMNVSTEKKDTITFGSVKEKELEAIYSVIKRLKDTIPHLKIYIAPRELHLADSMEEELKKHYRIQRYSVMKKEDGDRQTGPESAEIVIVDTTGDLLDIYEKSGVAFVGGSLAPYGGQNILEPLFFATPVIFGPFIENFREIADMVLKKKAGIMVKNHEDLYEKIKYLLENKEMAREMGERGRDIIKLHRGYMEKTVEKICKIIERGHE